MRGVKRTFKELIILANDIHDNKYHYYENDYKNLTNKTKIKCPIHGIFKQSFKSHIYHKNGCFECGKKKTLTTECFIKKAKLKHKSLYDYKKVNYINNTFKVSIICKNHGVFYQTPMGHLNGNGCPSCNVLSKGELFIKEFLDNLNIDYIKEKTFHKCKNYNSKRLLRFDFYIPSLNLCIEFDGKQHFKKSSLFGQEEFKKIQLSDLIKDQFCSQNSIRLIRIDYKYNIKEIF
jgi:hypothetical protein